MFSSQADIAVDPESTEVCPPPGSPAHSEVGSALTNVTPSAGGGSKKASSRRGVTSLEDVVPVVTSSVAVGRLPGPPSHSDVGSTLKTSIFFERFPACGGGGWISALGGRGTASLGDVVIVPSTAVGPPPAHSAVGSSLTTVGFSDSFPAPESDRQTGGSRRSCSAMAQQRKYFRMSADGDADDSESTFAEPVFRRGGGVASVSGDGTRAVLPRRSDRTTFLAEDHGESRSAGAASAEFVRSRRRHAELFCGDLDGDFLGDEIGVGAVPVFDGDSSQPSSVPSGLHLPRWRTRRSNIHRSRRPFPKSNLASSGLASVSCAESLGCGGWVSTVLGRPAALRCVVTVYKQQG